MGNDAFEIAGEPCAPGPFVFTCEHATNRVPEDAGGLAPDDRPFLGDHWGWDVGAADLARDLAARTGSCAVLSGFSRLVCDPNRDPGRPDFVVATVQGHALGLNRGVDAAERRRRRERWFDPYHDAVDRVLAGRRALGPEVRLCSIHTFTPVFQGRTRSLEVGVLFDVHEEHARTLRAALDREGFATALNEPYSGHAGLIYAASRHGRAHGVAYLELEVRQDLVDTPERARAVGARVARALAAFAPRSGRARREGSALP